MYFIDNILSVFEQFADKNAFCIENKHYTYAYLYARAASIRKSLDDQWPGEQRIGIWLQDDIETYAAIVAVLLSGKTYIPIHPHHPADRIEQVVAQAQLKVILSPVGINERLQVSSLNTSMLPDSTVPMAAIVHNAGSMAYILFTSGSTGAPKGVPISYGNLNAFITAFDKLGYDVGPETRVLQMFDLTFDLSIMSYLAPLCQGGCVYTVSDKGMKYAGIYNLLTSHNITFALMVPSVLSYLRPYFDEIELPGLRYSLFCGEALHKDVVIGWAKCVPNAAIVNVYGPTEATIFCTTYPLVDVDNAAAYHGMVSIGKAMEGTETMIWNDTGEETLPDIKGELCLYGAQLTKGYLDEERNKGAFVEWNGKRYYRTGDIVLKNEDGELMYCGRVDNQVKIQGFRVELSEVEYHLRSVQGCPNAVAIVLEAVNGMTRLDVVFEGDAIDTGVIELELKARLPPYMLPSQMHFVPAFPLNANGKTDRKALAKLINQ